MERVLHSHKHIQHARASGVSSSWGRNNSKKKTKNKALLVSASKKDQDFVFSLSCCLFKRLSSPSVPSCLEDNDNRGC